MKKTVRILSVILMVALLMVSFSTTNVFAGNDAKPENNTATSGGELTPGGLTASYGSDDGGLSEAAGNIMGMIRNVAVVASVIIIMVLGVKFMLGSVEEKAEYKKSFMPLIIGIVCVVAATTIASFIFNMM